MALRCITLIEKSVRSLVQRLSLPESESADLVEVRFDALDQWNEETLTRIHHASPLPVVATLRSQGEGGFFNNSRSDYLLLVERLLEASFAYIDLELSLPDEELLSLIEQAKEKGIAVILSSHDIKGMPPPEEILESLRRGARIGGDIQKGAYAPRSFQQCLDLLRVANDCREEGISFVLVGMGAEGWLTRLLAEEMGSAIVYLSPSSGKERLFGQLSLDEYATARKLLSLGTVEGARKVFGVMGYPIEHSVSPAMHNAALRTLGKGSTYYPFAVREEVLGAAVEGLRALRISGVNVTAPLKEPILRMLDEVEAEAQAIGAVNTIVLKDGKLIGHNTDGFGFLQPLRDRGLAAPGKALLLGAGGSARAVAYSLLREGWDVGLLNRTIARAEAVVQMFTQYGRIHVVEADSLEPFLDEANLLVNCTPVGMVPDSVVSPLSKHLLHKKLLVYDLVYNPMESKLLREASEVGARTVSGIEMLVHQGAQSFTLFTGEEAPVSIMRHAVRSALDR